MSSTISTFTLLYEQGLLEEANQLLCPTPDSIYPQDPSQIAWHLTNYADAAIWGGPIAYSHASHALQSVCQKKFPDSCLRLWLEEESRFFHLAMQEPAALEENTALAEPIKQVLLFLQTPWKECPSAIHDFVRFLPARFHNLFARKITSACALHTFLQQRPYFLSLIQERFLASNPWHPFTYKGSFPLQEGFWQFVHPYEKMPLLVHPSILVFPSLADLLQTVGVWPEVMDLRHCLYVLDIYPETHWPPHPPDLQKISPAHQPYFAEWREAFVNACQTPCREQFDRLYLIAKRISFTQKAHRYGISRAIPYSLESGLTDWHDPHRPKKPLITGVGPIPPHPISPLVDLAATRRHKRSFVPKERIRIAHIVSQIVDGGHAPTKLLRTLTTLADRDWFTPFIISTERFCPRPLSYPSLSYQSPPSQERAKSTLTQFASLAIPTCISPPCFTYEESLSHTLSLLEQLQIDIAVFHGPDELHTLLAAETAVPLRVLFDHGTLPSFGCFDLAILSTEESWIQSQSALLKLGMESVPLLFCIDPKETWEKAPFSRSQLGLPENAFILTTISNHLENRLSDEMCMAIGEILQRCPRAVYAPIGPIQQEARFRKKWEPYGVNDRIIFLGHSHYPSQLARSMHLYLNEFPFGSGLSLLDAMAAGCPVVSMYDPTGPQQAKYGGVYFGKDKVLSSLQRVDYVDLACQLIETPDLYQQWSVYAKQECEKRTDTKGYVACFEKILSHAIRHFFGHNRKSEPK